MQKTLIVILGPTATGKTDLSITLAKHLNTEIISADARQFYKEMNIGTAKPTPEQLKAVKHHLVNSLSVTDEYDVSRFEKDALHQLENIFSNSNTALLVGGSGLYIDAVCNGLDKLPPSEPELREQLQATFNQQGIEALQQQLKALDPEYYANVDLRNPHRLTRAIEVCLLTGKKYSSYRTKQNFDKLNYRSVPEPAEGFNIIKIGINVAREELYIRINARVDQMVAGGLLAEVKSLLPFRHLNALNTVGYKELFEYFDGKVALADAIEKIKQNTRNYAKRQMTWFKKDETIKWFKPEQANDILAVIRSSSGASKAL